MRTPRMCWSLVAAGALGALAAAIPAVVAAAPLRLGPSGASAAAPAAVAWSVTDASTPSVWPGRPRVTFALTERAAVFLDLRSKRETSPGEPQGRRVDPLAGRTPKPSAVKVGAIIRW